MNFWSYLVAFFTAMLQTYFNYMPTHETIGLSIAVARVGATSLGVLVVVVFGQINMTWPIIFAMCWIIDQVLNGTYGIWRFILKIIPMLN